MRSEIIKNVNAFSWTYISQGGCALLGNLTDDAIALLYVTKFSAISLYLTKIYVTESFQ